MKKVLRFISWLLIVCIYLIGVSSCTVHLTKATFTLALFMGRQFAIIGLALTVISLLAAIIAPIYLYKSNKRNKQ